MNSVLKKLYYALPFKREAFYLVRKFYRPSTSVAGYLKFQGSFKIYIGSNALKIHNDNLTVPTLLFWKGIQGYEPATLKVWISLSRDANVVFDVGANFGLFGLLSKAVNSTSKVTCFEPLTRNSNLISKNSALNTFDLEVVQAAVSNKQGSFTFYDMNDHDNTIGSFDKDFVLSHRHHKELIPTEVKTITIDAYADDTKLSSLDLLKIDVEGHEISVIDGARKTIAKFAPAIILEVSGEQGQQIEELLLSIHAGYQFYAIHEEKGLTRVNSLSDQQGRNFLIIDENKNLTIAT
jgi:FkbM family methyltransferase